MAKFVARMVVFFDKIFLFTFVQQICIRKNNSMNVYNMASFLHSDLFHFTNYWKSPLSPSYISIIPPCIPFHFQHKVPLLFNFCQECHHSSLDDWNVTFSLDLASKKKRESVIS